MLINYAKSLSKKLYVLLLFLILLSPGTIVNAQIQFEVDPFATEELEEANEEKRKGADLVTINNRFIYSLVIDIAMIILIMTFIYYPNYKKLDTVFTFIIFNIVILLLTFVLNKVKISMGAAFGLFAVFSMLRYRTEGIDMKDMTYLFVFIALGLISGIQLDTEVLLVICGIIFLVIVVMDSNIFLKREFYQYIYFDKIEMVRPESRTDLINELKSRTGLNIHRVSIDRLDYLRDIARIKAYYYVDKKEK